MEDIPNIFEVREKYTNSRGEEVETVYREGDPMSDMEGKEFGSVLGVCFYGEKMVLVNSRGRWNAPGGRIEPGESFEGAFKREVQEETNMDVLSRQVVGYQDLYEPGKLPRRYILFVCEVNPFGPFVSDPAGSVTEIKLIDPAEYASYLKWAGMGDRVMAQSLAWRKKIHT
jgi:8-oxo-dGTP pyrophosphatase MutT (NUDIX family)